MNRGSIGRIPYTKARECDMCHRYIDPDKNIDKPLYIWQCYFTANSATMYLCNSCSISAIEGLKNI